MMKITTQPSQDDKVSKKHCATTEVLTTFTDGSRHWLQETEWSKMDIIRNAIEECHPDTTITFPIRCGWASARTLRLLTSVKPDGYSYIDLIDTIALADYLQMDEGVITKMCEILKTKLVKLKETCMRELLAKHPHAEHVIILTVRCASRNHGWTPYGMLRLCSVFLGLRAEIEALPTPTRRDGFKFQYEIVTETTDALCSDQNAWLLRHFNDDAPTLTMIYAIEGGHLNVVKHIVKTYPMESFGAFPSWFCDGAADAGRINLLQWARAQNPPIAWSASTCASAAASGQIQTLQWLRENGCEWDVSTCDSAAAKGHLDVLIWAREHECEWTASSTCAFAAAGGHLDVLIWARENGCEWDASTCDGAAEKGHLRVLKWARKNGCAWTQKACDSAAENGHLSVLKWARKNGCEWSVETQYMAEDGNQKNVLKWLETQDTTDMYI